jgi:hypothetical protein
MASRPPCQQYPRKSPVQCNCDDFLMELQNRLQTAHSTAREKLVNTKIKSEDYYDQTSRESTLQVEDKVLLCDETVRRGISRKLSS